MLGRNYTLRYDNATGGVEPGELSALDGTRLIGCEADIEAGQAWGFRPGRTNNSQRGFVDLTDLEPLLSGGGADTIEDGILSRQSYKKKIVPFQYSVKPEPGEKVKIESSLVDRTWQDTDGKPGSRMTPTYFTQPQQAGSAPPQTATNFPTAAEMFEQMRSAYSLDFPRPPNGNGRRIVITPVNDPNSAGLVVGFAAFFLPLEPCARVRIGTKFYNPCCGEYIGAGSLYGNSGGGSPSAGVFKITLFE